MNEYQEDSNIVNNGGLYWGIIDSPESNVDNTIQASFIDEMSTVSSEVQNLLEGVKIKEEKMKSREKLIYGKQLELDLKERALVDLECKVRKELKLLEDGTIDAITKLETTITNLKKENDRLKESFLSLSKDHSILKFSLDRNESRNAKLEKQLQNANGRISNLLKLQAVKDKQTNSSVKEKEDSNDSKKEKPRVIREVVNNPALVSLSSSLLQMLSMLDHQTIANISENNFDLKFRYQMISTLVSFLQQLTNSSSITTLFPCLKLLVKYTVYFKEGDHLNPSLRSSFRKLTDLLLARDMFISSPHLHCRLLSAVLLTRISLQVIQHAYKQLLSDLNCEGAKEIFIDNGGHILILSNLKDPLQIEPVINVLTVLSVRSDTSDVIYGSILDHLQVFIDAITHDNSHTPLASILLQRLSTYGPAKTKLKQSAPLFRQKVLEHVNTDSMVELNFKSILMNINCFHQIPIK